uniref:Secreted protein n=1 Tax=Oryza brachyantha TaxID=4533 RepID=J3MXK1_ORYBR
MYLPRWLCSSTLWKLLVLRANLTGGISTLQCAVHSLHCTIAPTEMQHQTRGEVEKRLGIHNFG